MKYILTFLMLIGVAYAQEPTYTPMKGNYKFKGIRVDTLFLVPSFSDTASANATYLDQVAGAMIRCGNDFWMRNAATTAWLQNVNVGSGANPTVQYVDSIYRKSGKDSIYWRKGGVILQFKDSTGGGGGTDSPDRINGSGTKKIKADFNNFSADFANIDTFTINTTDAGFINIKTNKNIKINTTGFIEKKSGELQFGKGRHNMDIQANNDTIYIPGTYHITAVGSDLYLPDATKFAGQTIYIINDATATITLNSLNGSIYDQDHNPITDIAKQRFSIFTSDGAYWWGYNTN